MMLKATTATTVVMIMMMTAAPKLWNALPRELRDIPYLHNFKSHLKTHLFKFAHSSKNFNQLKIDISDFFCSSVYILIVFHIVNRISFSMLLLPL